jgi:hypothetical protein
MPSRILKESICGSETLNELSPEEEILFYRLIVQCDDFGRLDARPAMVRSKCFPLRVEKIKIETIGKWLHSLVKQGLIRIYTVNDKPYLQMITWRDHQQVRANKSKYPDPPTIEIRCNQPLSDSLVSENESESDTVPIIEIRESDTKALPEPLIIPSWINKEKWNAFMEVRKKNKAAQTDYAKKLIINELERLKNAGDDPDKILDVSIVNTWKSVYPLKNNGVKNNGKVYGQNAKGYEGSKRDIRTQEPSDEEYLQSAN